jgi:hypothetical protein
LNSNNGIKFIFLSKLLELLQISKCLNSIGIIQIKSGEKRKMLLCLWASPLLHLAQLGNMAQPTPASRPMAEAGEALPWHAVVAADRFWLGPMVRWWGNSSRRV